ncbi:hypothetical protein [Methylobacterium sp. A54F]
MKALCAAAAIGLTLVGSALAQPYGGSDYGYRDRDYGREYGGRDRGYRDRDDDDYRGRRGYGGGSVAFDAREYMRCNPDVRRAVERGQVTSAIDHYRVFGRREGRRLSC